MLKLVLSIDNDPKTNKVLISLEKPKDMEQATTMEQSTYLYLVGGIARIIKKKYRKEEKRYEINKRSKRN